MVTFGYKDRVGPDDIQLELRLFNFIKTYTIKEKL